MFLPKVVLFHNLPFQRCPFSDYGTQFFQISSSINVFRLFQFRYVIFHIAPLQNVLLADVSFSAWSFSRPLIFNRVIFQICPVQSCPCSALYFSVLSFFKFFLSILVLVRIVPFQICPFPDLFLPI